MENPLEKKKKLMEEFKKRKTDNPRPFSEFGLSFEPSTFDYFREEYKPTEEERNAINAAEEWLNVPEIFISARQMKFIADKHNTTIPEMRKALNYLR